MLQVWSSALRPGALWAPGSQQIPVNNTHHNLEEDSKQCPCLGKCLQPEDVARTVVGVVEMMGVADIQELSIEAPVTPQ